MRESDIRQSLKNFLLSEHASDSETLIIEELVVCQGDSRIDVAVINGLIAGFEIKSDQDTLARLPRQIESYGRVFDEVTIVTGERYREKVKSMIPGWWGIAIPHATGIDTFRRPTKNEEVCPLTLAQLLWKPELLSTLEILGLDRGVRSKSCDVLRARLATALSLMEISSIVRECLRKRGTWRPDQLRT